MDEKEAKAKAENVKGRVKQAAGAVTGDKELEAKGAAERAKGAAKGKAEEVKGKLSRDVEEGTESDDDSDE